MRQVTWTSAVLFFAAVFAPAAPPASDAKTIELKNGKLAYHQQAGGGKISFVHDNGQVLIHTDPSGKVILHLVQVGQVAQADLNGDGVWDATYDANKKKSFIVADGKSLEVRFDPKRGPGARDKISLDGKTKYFFGAASWSTQKPAPAPDQPVARNKKYKLPGGLIAFADAPDQNAGPRAMPHAQIYTITPDGKNRKQLTTGKPGNFFPAWSPDGKQLAFTSVRNHKREIWIVDSAGKNERLLTGGFLPSWSPDGRKMVITRFDAKKMRHIWVIGVDGKGERQLTKEGSSHCPVWSPKGDKIAYWSGNARGFGQVWVMNSGGTQQRALTKLQKNSYTPKGSSSNAPAWSCNGRIAYWSGIEHRYGQIWTMNPDGRDKKQLTDQPAPITSDNPTWSPDGKHILFDTQRRKRPEIWIMNSDGSDQRVFISNLKVIPMRTSWQPVVADGK
jgi:Tol biopolymer transport system component